MRRGAASVAVMRRTVWLALALAGLLLPRYPVSSSLLSREALRAGMDAMAPR